DYQFQAAGHAAEVVLARLLRDTGAAEDARNVRVLHVGADADPALHAEVGTAVDDEAGMTDVDVFAWSVELRGLLVAVGAEAGADIGTDGRRQLEPVACRHLEGGDLRGERDAEVEGLSVVDERPLAGFVEARGRQLDEDLLLKDQAHAAA